MDDQKTIFEGLYQIDWNSLQHIDDEPATGVPEALQDLLSNDAITRAWARRILFDEEKADWGVFTGAYPYIVPFVCDLLPFDAVQERSRLLFNLRIILDCSRSFISTSHVKDYVSVYSAIEVSLPVILTLLHHQDEDVRWGAADLLGAMDGNIEAVVPELVGRFKIEGVEYIQLTILESLEKLFSQDIPSSLSL